jgi:cytochrome c
MKHPMISIAAGIVIAMFQTVASAEVDAKAAQAELKEHGCLTCHAIDKKKVGPAYQDVAAKFKGKTVADAVASMKSKPEHGGVLKKTQDDELNMMIEWILTLSK